MESKRSLEGDCHLPNSAFLGRVGRRDKVPGSYEQTLISYEKKVYLAPGFRGRVKNLPMKPVVLLRYLIGKWKYHYLTWGEREILEQLCVLLQKTVNGVKQLFKYLGEFKFHPTLDKSFAQFDGFLGRTLQSAIFFHEKSGCKIPSFRNWKGLRVRRVHLEYLLSEEPVQQGKSRIRRTRKRGHTDHGTLPADPVARRADKEGGQLLSERDWENKETPKVEYITFLFVTIPKPKWFEKFPSSWF